MPKKAHRMDLPETCRDIILFTMMLWFLWQPYKQGSACLEAKTRYSYPYCHTRDDIKTFLHYLNIINIVMRILSVIYVSCGIAP